MSKLYCFQANQSIMSPDLNWRGILPSVFINDIYLLRVDIVLTIALISFELAFLNLSVNENRKYSFSLHLRR